MKPADIKVLENELDHIERFIPQSESINTSI